MGTDLENKSKEMPPQPKQARNSDCRAKAKKLCTKKYDVTPIWAKLIFAFLIGVYCTGGLWARFCGRSTEILWGMTWDEVVCGGISLGCVVIYIVQHFIREKSKIRPALILTFFVGYCVVFVLLDQKFGVRNCASAFSSASTIFGLITILLEYICEEPYENTRGSDSAKEAGEVEEGKKIENVK